MPSPIRISHAAMFADRHERGPQLLPDLCGHQLQGGQVHDHNQSGDRGGDSYKNTTTGWAYTLYVRIEKLTPAAPAIIRIGSPMRRP
jgi:hypothetical protein